MKKLSGVTCVLCLVLAVCFGEALSVGADPQDVREIEITVSPKVLVLASDVTWVTDHTNIPLSCVARSTVALNDVPVAWTKADAKGNLVAKFRKGDIAGIIPASAKSLTVTLTGVTLADDPFAGTDTIRVKQ